MSPGEERRKLVAALARSVPITRMLDYGVAIGDAMTVHEAIAREDPPAWDEICESLAQRHVSQGRDAAAAGRTLTAAGSLRAASALLQCAQLAFNEDCPRKSALYGEAHALMAEHGAQLTDLTPLQISTDDGPLYGWQVATPMPQVTGVVIVMGGLSGWGASFLDMGRALAARGLMALLVEGPGQGLTRMKSAIHYTIHSAPLLARFLDHAESLGARRFGVWGNSFGGLFAAHLALQDRRVGAVCINGAPMEAELPAFRTAREQMHAVFGTDSDTGLAEVLRSITLTGRRHETQADMLMVQGGRDVLVPLGSQTAFAVLTRSQAVSTFTWDDGEHTIYNHAVERNARVADHGGRSCPSTITAAMTLVTDPGRFSGAAR